MDCCIQSCIQSQLSEAYTARQQAGVSVNTPCTPLIVSVSKSDTVLTGSEMTPERSSVQEGDTLTKKHTPWAFHGFEPAADKLNSIRSASSTSWQA